MTTPIRPMGQLAFAEASIASAATVDLGASTARWILITGTTTITSFGAAVHQEKWVRFAAALTLTHNATSLVLPGGADVTTAAGDAALLRSDGSGNWRVIVYERADGGGAVPLALAAGGTGATSARGAAEALGVWRVVGWSDGPSLVHTGTTAQTVIDRVTVPGGAMGPNGGLRISALWQYTDSASNKILRARTAAAGGDGLTGHTIAEVTVSTTRTFSDTRIWRNQNSQSVQAGFRAAAANAIAATATTDYATGAQDTSVDFDIVFTAELASGSANAQLVWWMVEVFHGA